MAGGGAWKVAYADFVTAMMALFMVLWISAQDEEILLATSQYFQSPFNSPLDKTAGVLPFGSDAMSRQSQESANTRQVDSVDLSFLNSVAREFYRLLNVPENEVERTMKIEVTSDGLKITLFDRPAKPIFEKDRATFTEWGRIVMQSLAWLIDRDKFRVIVEGHTRSGYNSGRENYSAWDLSTDQANAARRMLAFYAVEPALFERVSGFADTRPLANTAPDDESNQRITLSLSLQNARRHEAEKTSKPIP